jgi:hypothetical protein
MISYTKQQFNSIPYSMLIEFINCCWQDVKKHQPYKQRKDEQFDNRGFNQDVDLHSFVSSRLSPLGEHIICRFPSRQIGIYRKKDGSIRPAMHYGRYEFKVYDFNVWLNSKGVNINEL